MCNTRQLNTKVSLDFKNLYYIKITITTFIDNFISEDF